MFILGPDPKREVYLVTMHDGEAMGQLVGTASLEHRGLHGPVAVDVAKRTVLFFDENNCIQRCPLDQAASCRVSLR